MIQYDAAVRYLEKKEFKKATQNTFHILMIIGCFSVASIILIINLLYK